MNFQQPGKLDAPACEFEIFEVDHHYDETESKRYESYSTKTKCHLEHVTSGHKKDSPFQLTVKPLRKPYSCTECGRNFSDKSNLNKHKRTHESQKNVRCPLNGCEKTFKTEKYLKNHIKIHEHDNHLKFTCDKCNRTFLRKYSLHIHQKHAHFSDIIYLCKFGNCKSKFVDSSNYKRHILKLHLLEVLNPLLSHPSEKEEKWLVSGEKGNDLSNKGSTTATRISEEKGLNNM